MEDDLILEVKNLCQYFPIENGLFKRKRKMIKAVDGISLNLHKGEILGIVGESGCGKSTLIRSIAQLYTPLSGEVLLHGIDLCKADERTLLKERRNMQMVFQSSFSSLDPKMTVESIISEPMIIYNRRGMLDHNWTKEEIASRVIMLLERTGMSRAYMTRYPHELSGGQRQRVAIARALMLNPEIILADEILSALDVYTASQILKLITSLKEEMEIAFILICHDLNAIRQVASRVIVMYLGRIMEEADVKDIFENPHHPYTRALLASAPSADFKKRWKKPLTLDKDISSSWEETQGCSFYSRCPDRMDHCKNHIPQMRETDTSHSYACFI